MTNILKHCVQPQVVYALGGASELTNFTSSRNYAVAEVV
jgi:hypothetical protein